MNEYLSIAFPYPNAHPIFRRRSESEIAQSIRRMNNMPGGTNPVINRKYSNFMIYPLDLLKPNIFY